MLSPKLLSIISSLMPSPRIVSESRLRALSGLDTQHMYVENVRSILDVNSIDALRICERAVAEGLFERGVEVRCPQGGVAAVATSEHELPPVIECWIDEDGHTELVELRTRDLEKINFYVLNG